jgi:hypothetical protein
VDVESANAGSPDRFHGYFNLTRQNIKILAGSSFQVSWNYGDTLNNLGESYSPQSGDILQLKLVTTVGNTAACRYS